MRKTVAILGATGSVGMQAASVAESRRYAVDLITANRDVRGAEELARRLSPKFVAMADVAAARDLAVRLADTAVKVFSGKDGILSAIELSESETVINSIIGEAGLEPTLAVIEAKKRLALANKESLVIAGEEVMRRAKARGVEILPVDSEHSAIFQSLASGKRSEIKKLILTASGGPFFGRSRAELASVTAEQALAHPTWKMGRRITVDSATLMNKGFEIIEAAHLFGVAPEKIEVVVHRESILHSAVEYIDNTVVGELSVPDMRMCVQYAVDYPERCPSQSAELDLFSVGALTFKKPDGETFPLLDAAKRAMRSGGAMTAVLNAADEAAVSAFLAGRIGFLEISDVVIRTLDALSDRASVTDLDGIIASDREARKKAEEIIAAILRR